MEDVNFCEDVTCNANSSCNTLNGNCECKTGYNNCDGTQTNGCETKGSCNTSPIEEEEVECKNNNECNTGEICEDNQCVLTNNCSNNDDCIIDEICVSGQCKPINCGEGFIIENKSCECEGTICNETCQLEKGVCCKNNWNPLISNCEIDISKYELIINSSNNPEIIFDFEKAQKLINNGEIAKGKSTVMLIALDSKIQSGNTELTSDYALAKFAIDEKDYENAELIIESALNRTTNPVDYTFALIIIFIVLISGLVLFLKFKQAN